MYGEHTGILLTLFRQFFATGFLIVDYLGSVFGGGRHVVLIVLDQSMFVSYAKVRVR